jgi:hypothetical protein
VDFKTFLAVRCNEGEAPWGDHVRISGFSIFGTTDGQQTGTPVAGIRVRRCVDVQISNMEIHGFSGQGILVENKENDPLRRITDFNQVRIHNNFIHHNQHPSVGDAYGYGVETGHGGARAHVYRNVFDFNRHAISAAYDTGGYKAEENLILKGGGYHAGFMHPYTHIFDAHGSGCWWSHDLCGNAGEEFHYFRNSFQYGRGKAIHFRGRPSTGTDISENVFLQDKAAICCTPFIWPNEIKKYACSLTAKKTFNSKTT